MNLSRKGERERQELPRLWSGKYLRLETTSSTAGLDELALDVRLKSRLARQASTLTSCSAALNISPTVLIQDFTLAVRKDNSRNCVEACWTGVRYNKLLYSPISVKRNLDRTQQFIQSLNPACRVLRLFINRTNVR